MLGKRHSLQHRATPPWRHFRKKTLQKDRTQCKEASQNEKTRARPRQVQMTMGASLTEKAI